MHLPRFPPDTHRFCMCLACGCASIHQASRSSWFFLGISVLSWACPTGKPQPHVRSEASISFSLKTPSKSDTSIFNPPSSFQVCLLSKNQFVLPILRGLASMQLSSGLSSCIPIPSILALFLKKRTPQRERGRKTSRSTSFRLTRQQQSWYVWYIPILYVMLIQFL